MRPPVRVCHVIDNLNFGGTERQMIQIVRHVDRAKFAPHVVYFREGPLLEELRTLEVPLAHIPVGPFWRPDILFQLSALRRQFMAWRIGIVQAYGFYTNVPAILAARWAGVPHRIAGRREMAVFLRPAQRRVERFVWRWADRVVVNAEAIKRDLAALEAMSPDRIRVVYNGVDCEQFIPRPPDPQGREVPAKVGMVANFRVQKDHDTFVRAAARVARRFRTVEFHLIGDGNLREMMESLTTELGFRDRVIFHGSRQGDALRDLVASLTISVLSSRSNEGLPNVILESMAAGKPVVATRVGGCAEVVREGQTGFLVEPRNPEALSERILWLLDHPEAMSAMGRKAREVVESEFTYSRMARHIEEVYEDVLSATAVRAEAPVS